MGMIFISHSERDRELAGKLADALIDDLSLDEDKLFCSSHESFKPPPNITISDIIEDAVNQTMIMIALITPHALESNWVPFELGAAKSKKATIYTILSPGLNESDLPGSLSFYSALAGDSPHLSTRLGNMIGHIAELLGMSDYPKVLSKGIDNFRNHLLNTNDIYMESELSIEDKYKLLRVPNHHGIICCERASESDFGIHSLLDKIKHEIIIAAQNWFWPINPDPLLKDRMRDTKVKLTRALDEGKKISMLLCDPLDRSAVRTWRKMIGQDYEHHLYYSILKLSVWLKEPELSGLSVLLTPLVPTSIHICDPEDDSGFIVFTPHTGNPATQARPVYVLSKKNCRTLFNDYVNDIKEHWVQRMSEKVVKNRNLTVSEVEKVKNIYEGKNGSKIDRELGRNKKYYDFIKLPTYEYRRDTF